jgi:hypothetical protein
MRRFLFFAALAGCALVAPGLAHAAPSPDGTGTLGWFGDPVGNPSTGNFVPFTFSLASGEQFQEGELRITVPSGWSAPSTDSTREGYTTSDCGAVQVSGQTITIEGMNITGPSDCEVMYGDLPGPGVSVPPTSPGGAPFSTETRATLGGTFTPIATSPEVWVTSPDGSGTLAADTQTVPNGSTGNTINFTYTAAFGGIFGGAVTLTVPPGWSPPDDSDPTQPGFTTADVPGGCGCPPIVFVDGRTIFVFPLFLAVPSDPETTLDITYGDKTGGTGPGATAPTTSGKQHWPTKEASNCGCDSVLRKLSSAPAINVLSPDGSGTMKASASTVSANSRNTITFKYAAAPGGMSDGAVTLDVPTDWSPPSTTAGQDGYVTASAGTVSTAGQTITVSGLSLFGNAVTITYGSKAGGGAGALAPTTPGPHTWFARERSSSTGTITPLFISPQITVYAADGSGTLTTPTTDVSAGSTGNTIHFTYTADSGGIQNGVVVLTVPPGWSAPSTSSANPGYTTSSAGNVATSGRKITVSGLTVGGGGTFLITYGASSGATAPATAVGDQTWTTKERSTNTGVLTPLSGGSPLISVI